MERWRERLKGLFLWRRVEEEVADEMRFHLDMEIAERMRAGMSPEEARRSAHADFGGLERYREQAREGRWGHTLEAVFRDVRYGARSLIRTPGFTLAVLLSLALGIGANTAVFSVVRSALLRPLPYDDPGRILTVRQSWTGTPEGRISPAEFLDYSERLEGFESFGVLVYDQFELVGTGTPEMVRAGWLSPGALASFGVRPVLGRAFTEAEALDGTPVALVSERFWLDRLGGDETALGATLTLNGREVEVIGVMPDGFRLPRDVLSGFQAHVFRPLAYTPEQISIRGSHFLTGVGRLPPGGSVERASASVAEVAAWMAATFPDDYPRDMAFTGTALPMEDVVRGSVRTPILVLMGAVGLVLLVACGNVANLFLARAEARAPERALRSVLGAGQGRIAARALTESLLLAVAGGALGVCLAWLATDGLARLAPAGLGWLQDVRVDGWVLGFSLLISLLTGVVTGLLPVLRTDPHQTRSVLQEQGARGSSGRERTRLRAGLIVAELAVAVVLLSGAGLLTRSFAALVAQDPGYRTEGLVTATLNLPSARYGSADEIVAFYRDLVPLIEAIPGVTAAGAVTNLPLATSLGDLNFRIEGRTVPEGEVSPKADWQAVTAGYFEAMGVAPVRGRVIQATDDAGTTGVVVINQTLARMYWPDQDPLGQRFELGGGAGPGTVQVVGVVPDVRHGGLDEGPRAQMYLAHQQFRFWGGGTAARTLTLVVASPLPAASLVPRIVERVGQMDPSLPVGAVRTMADVRSGSVAVPRLLMALVGAFAVVALALAGVGVYGLTSYAVGRRTREFGIRVALGARPGEVTRMVVGQSLRLAAAGIVVGVVGAVVAGRLLASLLYGVSPLDPVTLAGVPLVLAAVAVVASVNPARRAVRTDPVDSLRAE